MKRWNIYATILMALLIVCRSQVVDLSEEALQKEHSVCTALRNDGADDCIKGSNCCYYEYYEPTFKSHMPVCTSVNSFRQLYAIKDTDYLKRLNLSNLHSYIRTSSFCSIIPIDPDILSVRYCRCNSLILCWSAILFCVMMIFYI